MSAKSELKECTELPKGSSICVEDLPPAIRDRPQWVVHSKKKPLDRDGNAAGWTVLNDSFKHMTAAEALKIWREHPRESDGIGIIVFFDENSKDQVLGGDLDACLDPITGEMSPFAREVLDKINSYSEPSISGTGLRFFVFGNIPSHAVTGYGPQNDMSVEMKRNILRAKPKVAEKIREDDPLWNELPEMIKDKILSNRAKLLSQASIDEDMKTKAWNHFELYDDVRHLTVTGGSLKEYPADLEGERQEMINEIIKPFLDKIQPAGDGEPDVPIKAASDAPKLKEFKPRLPPLDIRKVIDIGGPEWTIKGEEYMGPNPIIGSSTGHNLLVNLNKGRPVPGGGFEGLWSNFHFYRGGSAPGGDAWTWLACEAGLVPWETAGKHSLSDSKIITAIKRVAVERGFFKPDELGLDESEGIALVSVEDDVGCIGLHKDGTIRKVKISKDGKKSLKWISDCAVCIQTETKAEDETEFIFRGRGAQNEREVSFTIPASELAEPRKFKAALINMFGARNRVGDLNFDMVQSISRGVEVKKRVEIPAWDGPVPLIPGVGVDLTGDIEYKLSTMTPAKVYEGDLYKAKECLRKFFSLHEYAPILMAAILGAPAIARWHSDERFGIGLWGLTGSLKTSVTQAAMSVYGTGYLDDAAIFKHGQTGTTGVAALEVFVSAGILPQILDNIKTVNPRDSILYVSIVQAVIEGREKLRGAKDGGLRKTRIFRCTPVITGEIRPEEASTTARILNLTWTRPEDPNALTYVQENVELMPVIGYHWLRFLASTDHNLVDGFADKRSEVMKEYSSITNPGRLATIYTLLGSVWNLLCESPLGDVFMEFKERFFAALNKAIKEQGSLVTEETEVEKFTAGLAEMIASDPMLVIERAPEYGTRPIGRIDGDELFLLPNETLMEMTKKGIFTQKPTVDSMTKALHSAGKLIRSSNGRLKTQRRINGKPVWGWLLSMDACGLVEIPEQTTLQDSVGRFLEGVISFKGVTTPPVTANRY